MRSPNAMKIIGIDANGRVGSHPCDCIGQAEPTPKASGARPCACMQNTKVAKLPTPSSMLEGLGATRQDREARLITF